MTPDPHPKPSTPRGTPHEPVPTAAEAFVICGVLLAGIVSCWMLYRPYIEQMFRFLRAWISGS